MKLSEKLSLILLVDDNKNDNFLARRALNKANVAHKVEEVYDGLEAIDFLTNQNKYSVKGDQYAKPDLILLDINMPKMDGWEFLEVYKTLDEKVKGSVVLIMLTSSQNPDDIKKAKQISDIGGFATKHLRVYMIEKIIKEHFPDRVLDPI